jgi:hypothetical protein
MKKLTKKTLMAIFALVLAVVALGTTTYAWFTVGQEVSTEEFVMDVRSDEGLEVHYINSDGTSATDDWTTHLTSTYLKTKMGGSTEYDMDMAGFKFGDATSTNGRVFKSLNIDATPVALVAVADNQASNSPVLEFRLEFRTKASGKYVAWSEVNLASDAETWAPSRNFTHNKTSYGTDGLVTPSDSLAYYPHHAARVSVSNADDTVTKVYEDGTTDVNTVLSNGTPDFTKGAHGYFNALTGKSVQPAFVAAAETFTNKTTTGFSTALDNSSKYTGYYSTSVIVRVYLEGFDPDTINGILGGQLKITLKFRLAVA